MSRLTEKIRALAEPVAAEEGCSIWDVEYVREGADMILRITIDTDAEGGITIDDCEKLHRAIDPILDEADPIPDSYVFEVSSAGLERELKRPSDFERFMGSEVEVKFYRPVEGSKSRVGVLSGYDAGNVTILCGGEEKRFAAADVAQVRLHVTF